MLVYTVFSIADIAAEMLSDAHLEQSLSYARPAPKVTVSIGESCRSVFVGSRYPDPADIDDMLSF